MAKAGAGMRKSTLAGLLTLPLLFGLIIYGSLQVSMYECTVCITFKGNESCRTVTGQTKEEGLQSAMTNACALIAWGMTDTLACSRTLPSKAECVEIRD